MRFLFLAFILSACTTVSQPETFQLPTGEMVECLTYEQMQCGMAVRGCGDKHSVEYECLKSVKYTFGGPPKVARDEKTDVEAVEGETK